MESKILIVDDDASTHERLVQEFSCSGFQVFSSSDGTSALFQFGIVQPNVIILSTSLPEMDGWETLQRVRQLSNVPVIALVASDDEQAKIESLRRGADQFMTKPLSTRELYARICALLRRAQHTAPMAG